MNGYPYKLQRDINSTLGVFTRGDGFVFWRFGEDWKAQHPDMNPEHFLWAENLEDVDKQASDWMAFRRAQKEAKS